MTSFQKKAFLKSILRMNLQNRSARRIAPKSRLLRLETLEDRRLLTASIGLNAIDAQALEGSTSDPGMWRLERADASQLPVTVALKLSGTATWGDDYRLYVVDASGATTELTPTSDDGELFAEATLPSGTLS